MQRNALLTIVALTARNPLVVAGAGIATCGADALITLRIARPIPSASSKAFNVSSMRPAPPARGGS